MNVNQFAIDNDLYADFVSSREVKLSGQALESFSKWGFKESITDEGKFDWESGNPWEEWSSEAIAALTEEEKTILGELADDYAQFCLTSYNA